MKNFLFGIAFIMVAIAAFIGSSFAFGRKKPLANCTWVWSVTHPTDGTTFTVSSDRNSRVYYTIAISCTATIGSSAAGTVKLQVSQDGGSTWNDAPIVGNSNTVTLAVVLNSVAVNTIPLVFEVPAGALCKFITTTSGTTTVTWVNGVEVLYDN